MTDLYRDDALPPQSKAPAVSVIIPARDAAPTLDRTLAALTRQQLEDPYEVVVVDDGSRDETLRIARRYQPFVKVLHAERSAGPGAARNRGAAATRGPILAFTDADCFPTRGWLAAGLDAIRDVDLVQGAVQPDPSVPRTPFDRTVEVESETGFYPTANLLVRRDLFETIGGFRDWTLDEEADRGRRRRRPADKRRARAARTPIGEDTLFAWTGLRLGARSAYRSDVVVHHAVVPGTLWDDVCDRWHWARDIPAVAYRVPELREGCFYRRWFFHAKTARFDLAVGSVVLACITRRRLALLGASPYVAWIGRESVDWGWPDGLHHAVGSLVTDLATCGGLLVGSVTRRCVVL